MKKNFTQLALISLLITWLSFYISAQQLSGVYTINPNLAASATNFQTIQAAVDSLTTNGVDSRVVFNVASGTYTGQVTIPAITGADSINTITFQSEAQHADSVTLNYAAGSGGSSNSTIVTISNASYISFKYITVASLTQYGTGFSLTSASSYDSIVHCKITTGTYGIQANDFTGKKNVFNNNVITGGGVGGGGGIFIFGTSASYADSNIIANNTIQTAISGASPNGLILRYNANTLVVNNSIISNYCGIYTSFCRGSRFYHNTVSAARISMYVDYTSATASDDNEWRNNIITATGAATYPASAVTYAARIVNNTGTNNTWDYNLYYAPPGANLFYDTATAYAAWQAGGQDGHSVVMDPGFISDTELRLSSGCDRQGISLADITTDIAGNPRSNPPTMGAYEYNLTDNIAVDAILQPVNPVASGVQDLVVRIKNTGLNTVNSFKVNYTLNNGTSVSHSVTDPLAPCDTVSVTFYSVNLQIGDLLTVYTSDPNGNSDTYIRNDTITMYIMLGGGTYTIGTSGNENFTSFNEAVTALVQAGVSGPVIFDVKSGFYNEQINIPAIQYASITNTITFQSAAQHADSVTLNYAASSSDAIVTLTNASYISFKYITIASTTSTGRGIELSGTASYDSIIHCKITTGNYGIYANSSRTNGFTGKKNVFSNNAIIGGAYGIYLYGYSFGTYADYMDSNIIVNNTIQTSTNAGLTLSYNANTFVANNSISSNTGGGILSSLSRGSKFYHNTIRARQYGIYIDYSSATSVSDSNEWKNNIISSEATVAVVYTVNNILGTNNNWDYNLYYTDGVNLFYNSNFSGRLASGQDSHSVVMNPEFISNTDLRLSSGCGKQGISLADVTTDIEDNIRSNPPTMGAYELLLSDNIEVDTVFQPIYPLVTGLQDVIIRVKNAGSNTVTSFNVGYILNNGSAVTQQWTGNLAPCDTVTVTLTGANQVNIDSNTFYIFKAFTDNPNNTQDNYRINDTISLLLRTPLNGGTYTIGGVGADFPDFTSAVTVMNLGGITGDVVFNVKTDTTFTENPIIVSGAAIVGSDLYSITFRKAGTGANPVVYGINGIGGTDAVITLRGISNITFDGIDVADSVSNITTATRMEYGYKIINTVVNFIIIGNNNNIIKNSKITLNRTNANSIGILQSATATGGGYSPNNLSEANHNNRYENIRINNSYNGILLTGDVTYPDSGNVITASAGDTTIIDNLGGGSAIVYGIQLMNQKNTEVSNSIVKNLTTSSVTAYGIYLNNTSTVVNGGNAIIKNNRVYNITSTSTATTATGGVFGIRVDISPIATAIVFNNVVYGLNKGNSGSANANVLVRGIGHCIAGNGNASYFNNTVSVTSGISTNVSSAAFWKGGIGTGTTVQNNAFVNTTGTQTGVAGHYAIYNNTTANIISSNNLLWSTNGNGFTGYYIATNRQTLSDWQTATNQDKYSVAYPVVLAINNFLYPNVTDTTVWALNGRGAFLDSSIISTDINGNPRPLIREDGVPDIGAYQFTPDAGVLAPLAKTTDTLAIDSTQIFFSPFSSDTVAKIKWGSVVPTKVEVRQYAGEQPKGTSTTDKFMYCYVDVKDSGSGSYGYYDIHVYYQDAWLGKITEDLDIRMQKRTKTANWAFYQSGYNSSVDTARNIITDQYLETLGTFTGVKLGNPLPVQLLSLKATAVKTDVLLAWATASEINVSHFVVERLVSGNQWLVIGKREAKGNSSSINNYQFTDQSPFTNHQSLYYRLRIVDNDGSYEYSKVVSVNQQSTTNNQQLLSVYPNPFNSQVNVEFMSVNEGIANINIIDITGRDVQLNISKRITKGNNVLIIDTDKLNKGIYFLSLDFNGEKQVMRLVKQ